MKVEQMEGYDEVMQKMLDRLTPKQRLAGLAPEQVLSAFDPEQVLSALKPEQRLPALPDALLRALSDDYIDSLPHEIRDAIRKRIGR